VYVQSIVSLVCLVNFFLLDRGCLSTLLHQYFSLVSEYHCEMVGLSVYSRIYMVWKKRIGIERMVTTHLT